MKELAPFDNIYYEVMNEPYIRHVPMEWQKHIIDTIVAAEPEPDARHLISLNVANGKATIQNPHPAASVFNFHYAWPPETVGMNRALNKALGDNETGFKGTGDFHYRREGWAFILAGGALYSHLDYSFVAGREDGTFAYPASQPGGGSAALRRQLGALGDFIRGFDVVHMQPAQEAIAEALPAQCSAYVLAARGREYAIYLCRLGEEPAEPQPGMALSLDLPAGRYRAAWLDPASGETSKPEFIDHTGGIRVLTSPPWRGDLALGLTTRP